MDGHIEGGEPAVPGQALKPGKSTNTPRLGKVAFVKVEGRVEEVRFRGRVEGGWLVQAV